MSVRVLHVVESLQPLAGSVAVTLPGLFKELAGQDVVSTVVTARNGDHALESVQVKGFDRMGTLAEVGDTDVVHLHGWGGEMARAIAGTCRKVRKPYVISPLGGLSPGPFRKTSWRDKVRGLLGGSPLIGGASAVAALNRWELQDLRTRKVGSTVVLLPYGLDVDTYQLGPASPPTPDDAPPEPFALVLGPIHPAEGLAPFLKALAETGPAADGWSVVFAGQEIGDWRRMLEAAIRRKGAEARVSFIDAPNVAEQRAWLGRCGLLASASLHVRCPVSVMQGMATGTPVVASNRVAPDSTDDAISICEPGRSQLRQALASVLAMNDTERKAHAERARHVARSLFDWSVLARSYAEIYRRLC